jgi:hypothetical protein
MRHLTRFALLLAAAVAYAAGIGPLFFGEPLLGTVLVLAGAGLEIGFWRRHRVARRAA